MNIVKSFSRRSFLWLFLLTLVLVAIINGAVFMGAGYISERIPPEAAKAAMLETPTLETGVEELWPVIEWLRVLFLPVSAGFFLFFFLVSWLVVRKILVRALRREGDAQPLPEKKKGTGSEKSPKTGKKRKPGLVEAPDFDEKAPAVDTREDEDRKRRYYLHLLAVLQREGRLVDFLTEDLSPYSDDQIGAAVRSIHENCRKSLEKHLAPQSVMEEGEGETVTVPADFDSTTIKLTGNVTGDPPFSGVLRHRGWRAGKLELPVLTATGDPKVITPAEVEVV